MVLTNVIMTLLILHLELQTVFLLFRPAVYHRQLSLFQFPSFNSSSSLSLLPVHFESLFADYLLSCKQTVILLDLTFIFTVLGFVTTTRITHATPSALYAHVPNRRWECDTRIPHESSACSDIARQLVEQEPGRSIKVTL